jgi:prepilin-type N-terminal cleavage/methylation domain-containing protein
MRMMSDRKSARVQRAFTLTEVLIAVLVFGIIILGTLGSSFSAWKLSRRTQERLYVAKILESRLEELRNLTFEELETLPAQFQFPVRPATTTSGNAVNPNIDDEQFRVNLRAATGVVYVDPVAENWKKVTVRVIWDSAGGANRLSETLATYIVKFGVGRR